MVTVMICRSSGFLQIVYFLCLLLGTFAKTEADLYTRHSRIPHTLWFTHSHDVLMSAEPKDLFDNMIETVRLYRIKYRHRKAQVRFLDNAKCEEKVEMAAPGLLPYFQNEVRGKFKAEICGVAALYLHGGIFFDMNLEVIEPFIPADHIAFTTATSNSSEKEVNPGFLGAEAGHPILKETLVRMLALYESEETFQSLGSLQVALSYKAFMRHNEDDREKREETYILNESFLDPNLYPEVEPQFGVGSCNLIIHDEGRETVHFFSRFMGSGKCKPYDLALSEDTIPHALWFASKYIVFDYDERVRANGNALDIITAYRGVWKDPAPTTISLSTELCVEEISAAEPGLLPFFQTVEEHYESRRKKLQMCKMAVLYNKGGYFFDANVTLAEGSAPFLADDNDSWTFATVRSPSGLLFDHFIASTPRNPVLLLALKKLLHAHQYGLEPSSLMGTATVANAYRGLPESHQLKSKILEVKPQGGWAVQSCNDVIYDREEGKSYFVVPSVDSETCV